MQPWEILKRKTSKKDTHPSSLMSSKGFSTALSLEENTWKRSASPKGSACNSRPTGRARAQLPAPAATFWGLYMEIRWDLLTERFGSVCGCERRRARGGAAGSEGLALPERLRRHRCPLPTPASLTWARTRYVWNLLEARRAGATSQSHWRLLWNEHTLSRRLHLRGLRMRRSHQMPPPWRRKMLAHSSRLGELPAATCTEFYSN